VKSVETKDLLDNQLPEAGEMDALRDVNPIQA